METRQLTCIGCPMGCALCVTISEEGIQVSGNTCPRGELYGREEVQNPVRILTTTLPTENGKMVSVKSAKGIPKDRILDCMKSLKGVSLKVPIHTGDIVVQDILDTGIDLIATKEVL